MDAIATNAQQQIDDLVANTNTGVTENADAIDDIVDGTTKVGNTDRLDGHDSTYFAQQSDMDDVVDYIQSIHYSAGVVGNSHKLGGHDSSYFAKKSVVTAMGSDINQLNYNLNSLASGTVKAGNAEKLDGHDSTYFATASALNAKLNASAYTANDVFSKVKSKDGSGSGLDADLLGGRESKYYRGQNNGSVTQDPNTATNEYILTKHANCPDSSHYWHIRTQFYNAINTSANRAQIAIGYNGGVMGATYARSRYSGSWSAWKRLDNVDSGGGVPTGAIMMWSGAISAIPSGWALCDGQNGTPDLRNRFIVGAGSSYNVGNTGGANTVTLSTSHIPSHRHGAGGLYASTAGNHNHSGSTSTAGAHTHTYTALNDDSIGAKYNLGDGHLFPDSGLVTQSSGNHSHSLSINNAGNHSHSVGGNTGYTGGGAAHENRPLYYALALIIKL